MPDSHPYIVGFGLLKQLAPAIGEDFDQLRRVVIDIRFDDFVAIYVEKLGDTRMLEIDWTGGLKDTEFRIVDVQSGFEPQLGGNHDEPERE